MVKNILKSIIRILLALIISLIAVGLFISRPTYVTQQINLAENNISIENLKKHVIFLSETAIPRSSQFSDNLNLTADYIKSELSGVSTDVAFQNYSVGNHQYKNVIAKFGQPSEEVIVIGAHYDAYSELPGADDNASGVAGLIELGHQLSTIKLNHQVILIAYTLEEPPFFGSEKMGSYIHAASIKNTQIKMMISLEMIGYYSQEPDSQTYPHPLMNLLYPDKGNFIAVVDGPFTNNAVGVKSVINQYTDLPAYSINAPTNLPGIDLSDHRNYWLFDFPAVMITDTSLYRNKAYHTKNDTFNRLNYDNMAKVVFGVFKYIQEIDKP